MTEIATNVPEKWRKKPVTEAGFRRLQPITDESVGEVLAEIVDERHRQDAKWGEQNHPDGTGPNGQRAQLNSMVNREYADYRRRKCQADFVDGYGSWAHILEEEVAEAYAAATVADLRGELIQVAAVAVAWVEAIDRRGGGHPDAPQAAESVRACRVCGCTDDHACTPPCWWVGWDLCSACAERADPIEVNLL